MPGLDLFYTGRSDPDPVKNGPDLDGYLVLLPTHQSCWRRGEIDERGRLGSDDNFCYLKEDNLGSTGGGEGGFINTSLPSILGIRHLHCSRGNHLIFLAAHNLAKQFGLLIVGLSKFCGYV